MGKQGSPNSPRVRVKLGMTPVQHHPPHSLQPDPGPHLHHTLPSKCYVTLWLVPEMLKRVFFRTSEFGVSESILRKPLLTYNKIYNSKTEK